jgi:AcrR family transcriptional regulator
MKAAARKIAANPAGRTAAARSASPKVVVRKTAATPRVKATIADGLPLRAAPEPRWQRRKQQRPGEILSAALDLFVERGFAATKLEDVAQRAGVTKGTMYLYFDSKEALFKEVVRQTIVPHIADFEQLAASRDDPARDLLAAFARGWMERFYGMPVAGLAKLVISEATNFPELARFYHEEVIDRAARVLASVLERGIANGEIRPLDVDYAIRVLRAPLIFAAVWKFSLMRNETCVIDPNRFLETYLDMMLNGVLATHDAEKPDVKVSQA